METLGPLLFFLVPFLAIFAWFAAFFWLARTNRKKGLWAGTVFWLAGSGWIFYRVYTEDHDIVLVVIGVTLQVHLVYGLAAGAGCIWGTIRRRKQS